MLIFIEFIHSRPSGLLFLLLAESCTPYLIKEKVGKKDEFKKPERIDRRSRHTL